MARHNAWHSTAVTKKVEKTVARPAKGLACCLARGMCAPGGQGLFFGQCNHWVCTPCAGLSPAVAKSFCPDANCKFRTCAGTECCFTDAADLRKIADTEIATCTSKLDAVASEAEADLESSPDARIVMVGASSDAVKAVCKHLNDIGMPARVLQLGAAGGRSVDAFNAGRIKVLLLKSSQNMGMDLFAATHLYILTPAESAASYIQTIGRVSRISTISAKVYVKEFVSVGIEGSNLVTIDEEMRSIAAADANGNATMDHRTLARLFTDPDGMAAAQAQGAAQGAGMYEDEDEEEEAPVENQRRRRRSMKRREFDSTKHISEFLFEPEHKKSKRRMADAEDAEDAEAWFFDDESM